MSIYGPGSTDGKMGTHRICKRKPGLKEWNDRVTTNIHF